MYVTQKEELTQALAKIEEQGKQLKAIEGLQAQITTANTNLKAAEGARDGFKTRAEEAEGKVSAAEGRADKAEKDLKAANDKVAILEAGKRTTDGAAAEQLASRGVNPQAADPAAVSGAGEDTQALADKFMKASMSEKSALLAKHGEKLRAFAAAQPHKG